MVEQPPGEIAQGLWSSVMTKTRLGRRRWARAGAAETAARKERRVRGMEPMSRG